MEQFESINKDKDYVRELQKEIGTTADGIFGPGSYKAARQYFDKPIMIHMGKIVPIDSPAEIDLSAPLYELDDGTKNWYTRKSDPSTICVHWGGLNSRHCYNVFNLARGRHVSSHFLLGRNHKTGELEILQCLDTGLAAYHAGKFNKYSIGIDICMHPQKKYWDKTKEWYPDASLDHYRGDDKRVPSGEIAMIGPEFSEFCRNFLIALRDATGLSDKPVCEDNEVYAVKDAANFSIVGHHNISAKKWDVVPWADKLYHGIDSNFS
jgi:hypothetical protein